MPILKRKSEKVKPVKVNRIESFFRLPEAKVDNYLGEVAEKAEEDCNTEAPSPGMLTGKGTSRLAQEETTLRDMAGQLFLLGGAKADDIDFLYQEEPDGSLVTELGQLVDNLFWDATPANKMAFDQKLVNQIVADCRAIGIVGERSLILAIYVIGTSRLLARPLSGIVQGKSSTGKTLLVEKVSKLFPEDHVLIATRMSPKALVHYKGGLAHKFVVAGESSRVVGDESADATAFLRQLQSDGHISQLTTQQIEGKQDAELVKQQGPISYVETTTLDPRMIFPEDLNRALLLKTDESEKQTRNILKHEASKYEDVAESVDTTGIIEKHRDFQRMLERRSVAIPFAGKLMDKLPAKKVEARRVAVQILSVIEAVTLLHQFKRARDSHGRLIATLDDYEIARGILAQPLHSSLGVPDSPARMYYKLYATYKRKPFTTKQAKTLERDASDRSVTNWLRQLADHDCIVKLKKAEGVKPAMWILNGQSPHDAVLPDLAVEEMS